MTITLRATKGSPLTHGEMDDNLVTLRDVASQTSGSINNVIIGASTAAAGNFTSLTASSNLGVGTTSPTQRVSVYVSSGGSWFGAASGGYSEQLFGSDTTGNASIYAQGGASIIAYTGGVARLRIDSTGNLGLGVTPSAWTSFKNVIQGASYAIASGANSGQTTRWFNNIHYDGNYRYTNGSYPGSWIEQTGGGVNFYAFTGNLGAGNIPSASASLLAVEKDKSVALQGATSQTGAGITFPATQSASSDANTLDDYEEGIFTPTIVGVTTAGVGTYTAQIGRYTKIGNVVYYRITVTWTAHTGTGNMLVGALPFTSNGTSGNNPPCSTYTHNITLTASNVAQCYVKENATRIAIEQYPAGGGASTAVPIDTAGQILLEGHYEI